MRSESSSLHYSGGRGDHHQHLLGNGSPDDPVTPTRLWKSTKPADPGKVTVLGLTDAIERCRKNTVNHNSISNAWTEPEIPNGNKYFPATSHPAG